MTDIRQLSKNLGLNVTRLRCEQRIPKKALAQMAGMSRPYLDTIENGTSDARLSHIQKLADALSVDPDALLDANPVGAPGGAADYLLGIAPDDALGIGQPSEQGRARPLNHL